MLRLAVGVRPADPNDRALAEGLAGALDARPAADPVQVVQGPEVIDVFDLLREPPRLYRWRGGALRAVGDK